MNGSAKFAAPSLAHLFGCDYFGRDVFSRVLKGTGTTFLVAAATVVLGGGTGILAGAFTGYFGGWADEILMRFNDAVFSFPHILLALVFISIMGSGKYNVILALAVIFVPSFARITRSEFLSQKEMDYVKSARLMGVSHLRIMFVHIFPNTLPAVLSMTAIGFNNAVLAEAGMSYLGNRCAAARCFSGKNAVGSSNLSGKCTLVCNLSGSGCDSSGSWMFDQRRAFEERWEVR